MYLYWVRQNGRIYLQFMTSPPKSAIYSFLSSWSFLPILIRKSHPVTKLQKQSDLSQLYVLTSKFPHNLENFFCSVFHQPVLSVWPASHIITAESCYWADIDFGLSLCFYVFLLQSGNVIQVIWDNDALYVQLQYERHNKGKMTPRTNPPNVFLVYKKPNVEDSACVLALC